MFLLLVFCATALRAQIYDPHGAGSSTTHYAPPALKEWQSARACLPLAAVAQLDDWLVHLTELHYHRLLQTLALEKLLEEMEAGSPLCPAVPRVLQRVLRRHQQAMDQRAALEESLPPGWVETRARLWDARRDAEAQCWARLSDWEEARTQTVDCMRRVQKASMRKTLVHHFP